MAGAGDDVAVRVAEPLGGVADRPDAAGVEGDRIEMADLLDLVPDVERLADRVDAVADAAVHRVELFLLGRADVDGEDSPAGDDVARVGIDLHVADRADGVGLVVHRHLVDEFGDARHAEPGIAALGHRRRAGMALLAGQRHLQPLQALAMGDDADVDAFVLEDRPLLDVQLEEGLHLARADRFFALPADALEFVAEALAGLVLAVVGPVLLVHAGKDARGEHGRGEARALLVGPVGDHDRMLRPDAEVVQRTDDLQTAQHAKDAVIFSAGRLGVEVAADIDRQGVGVGALAAGKHGAHLVDADCEPCRLAPALEEMAALAVLVGERLAIVAAGDAGADLRHLHQRIPQTVGIDSQIRTRCGHGTLPSHSISSARPAVPDAGLAGSSTQSICLSTSRTWSISSLI